MQSNKKITQATKIILKHCPGAVSLSRTPSFPREKQPLHGLASLLFFCLAWSWLTVSAAETALPLPIETNRIKQIIAAKQHPFLVSADFTNRSEDLDSLYRLADYQLIWLGNDQSEKNISDLLNLLSNAPTQGLNPDHYDVGLLRDKLPQALLQANDPANEWAGAYDSALSLSLLRLLHDIQYGRVNPQGMTYKLKPREKKPVELPLLIKGHLAQGNILELPEAVEPKPGQYRQLKSALAAYREMAKTAKPLHLVISQSPKPGDHFIQAEELRQFLIKTRNLAETADANTVPINRYTNDLRVAVKNFQRRHGLAADGVIGPATLAELNTPLSQGITKIELALERLRWLPEFSSGPAIIVNIPAFQLWAFDNINASEPNSTTMKVVVGQAIKTQTPVLMAEMRHIDFMPYWNVPYSITKNEIIPKLLQNPDYLAHQDMEAVIGSKPVGLSAETLSLLRQGKARIRQRPGKKNALGKVKFLFPNDDNVYLHDTPANALFNRSRRDFSHGCVRVEKPEKLAEFALRHQGDWDAGTIQSAMNSGKNKRVTLNQPIQVMFFYVTAFINQDNELIFYPDIYGHDVTLQEALRTHVDVPDDRLFASPKPPPVVSQVEETDHTDLKY